ncbi:hypothetical protein J6590_089501 [Homalodisca vitripennis]|nr:hypothetical protein J6590_089501 [Homalodisca vitripennis]
MKDADSLLSLFCSSWATGLCEDLIQQKKEESRYISLVLTKGATIQFTKEYDGIKSIGFAKWFFAKDQVSSEFKRRAIILRQVGADSRSQDQGIAPGSV